MKMIISKIKTQLFRLCSELKNYMDDDMWILFGGGCFELFPPAFYRNHTQQEILCITARTIKKLHQLIDELD